MPSTAVISCIFKAISREKPVPVVSRQWVAVMGTTEGQRARRCSQLKFSYVCHVRVTVRCAEDRKLLRFVTVMMGKGYSHSQFTSLHGPKK